MKFSTAAVLFSGLASLAAANPYPPGPPASTTTSTKIVTKVIVSTSTLTKVDTKTVHSISTYTVTETVPKFVRATVTVTPVTLTMTSTATVSTVVTETDTSTSTSTSLVTATTTSTTTVPAACLSTDAATNLVNGFASLLTAYNNDTANAILADDFTDTSDSINYLAGIPLGDPTFASKAAFMQGQGSQPAIGFDVLAIDAITCDTIAFRWTATLGAYPVKGIEVFYCSNTANTADGWQIESLYSEFNVGAWELDIGNTCGSGATVA